MHLKWNLAWQWVAHRLERVEIGNMPELDCMAHDSPVIKHCWYVALCWISLLVISTTAWVAIETASQIVCLLREVSLNATCWDFYSATNALLSTFDVYSSYCVGSTSIHLPIPIHPIVLVRLLFIYQFIFIRLCWVDSYSSYCVSSTSIVHRPYSPRAGSSIHPLIPYCSPAYWPHSS